METLYILCEYEMSNPKKIGGTIRKRILASADEDKLYIFARQLIKDIWEDFDSNWWAIGVESEILVELNKSLVKVRYRPISRDTFISLKQDISNRLNHLFRNTKDEMLRGARLIPSPLEADY